MPTDPTQGEQVPITMREVNAHRDRFRLASNAPSSERRELPLLEKQALVDEMFRGMPMRQFDCYRITASDGKIYYEIRKGWPQLRALLDFMDNKFPTWSDEDRRQWEESRGDEPGT